MLLGWAFVVAQLVERSLLTPEVHTSKPISSIIEQFPTKCNWGHQLKGGCTGPGHGLLRLVRQENSNGDLEYIDRDIAFQIGRPAKGKSEVGSAAPID